MISYLPYYIALITLLLVSCAYILLAGYRKSDREVMPTKVAGAGSRAKDAIYLAAIIVICYLSLACLLKQSWLQNDEWAFLVNGKLPFLAAVKAAVRCYLVWVSRVGQIGAVVMGLSVSRWQEWVITPIFASLAPLALFSLVRRKDDSLLSWHGRMFYLTAFVLFLLSVYLPRWRNYWCYAAAWNYLYPSVCLMYFLSFFRKDACYRQSTVSYVAVVFLGLVAGWGTECATSVVFPILTAIVIYNLIGKKPWLSFHAYLGYCGYMWGTAALFCSPALYLRSQLEEETIGLTISDLSAAEYSDFIRHLDWPAVQLLSGVSGVVSLKSIPLFDRIYFLPFIAERFLSCCGLALLFWLVFSICFLLVSPKSSATRTLLGSVSIVVLAFAIGFSYSVQCIPTPMSFLPAGFALVAACMFVYTRLSHRPMKCACSVLSLLLGLIIFVPAGIQAALYKDMDCRRMSEINAAKQAGTSNVILSTPAIELWWPSLGLIAPNDIKEHERAYPNRECARCYGFTSVKQPKANVKKTGSLPIWIFPDIDKKMFENSSPQK